LPLPHQWNAVRVVEPRNDSPDRPQTPPQPTTSNPTFRLTTTMPQASRSFRSASAGCESPRHSEAVPFLHDASGHQSLDIDPSDLEEGIISGAKEPASKIYSICDSEDDVTPNFNDQLSNISKCEWRTRIRTLYKLVFGRSRRHIRNLSIEKQGRSQRRRPSTLRRVLRAIAWLLMLL
jgi:hypothetical protein